MGFFSKFREKRRFKKDLEQTVVELEKNPGKPITHNKVLNLLESDYAKQFEKLYSRAKRIVSESYAAIGEDIMSKASKKPAFQALVFAVLEQAEDYDQENKRAKYAIAELHRQIVDDYGSKIKTDENTSEKIIKAEEFYNLGVEAFVGRDYESAEEMFAKAANIDTENGGYHHMLAVIRGVVGSDYDKGLEHINKSKDLRAIDVNELMQTRRSIRIGEKEGPLYIPHSIMDILN